MAFPRQVGGETLPKVGESRYLQVLFKSQGKMKREIDGRISVATAVMLSLYPTVMVTKELNRKAITCFGEVFL